MPDKNQLSVKLTKQALLDIISDMNCEYINDTDKLKLEVSNLKGERDLFRQQAKRAENTILMRNRKIGQLRAEIDGMRRYGLIYKPRMVLSRILAGLQRILVTTWKGKARVYRTGTGRRSFSDIRRTDSGDF